MEEKEITEQERLAAAKADAIENGKPAIDLEAESGYDKSSVHLPSEDNNEWIISLNNI